METLVKYLKTAKPKAFKSKPHYAPDGDSLTIHIKNMPSYREGIDAMLTVYKAIDGDELVGCQIQDLTTTVRLLKDLGLIGKESHVPLGMILLACMAQMPRSPHWCYYRELAEIAGTKVISRKELEPLRKPKVAEACSG